MQTSLFRQVIPLTKRVASVSRPLTAIRFSHHIKSLQAAFKDPASPFHIPPGQSGPAHPQDHGVTEADLNAEVAREAKEKLLSLGYDPASFWEQPVVWGDHDSFQHVNNVRYVRFFESGRIKWMMSLGEELGGEKKAQDMIKGRGISLILKSLSMNYKRPVTFPDTLLIAHKPHFGPSLDTSSSINPGARESLTKRLPKTHFHVLAVAYSYAQKRIVTECDSVLVWYNYDTLQKCDPGEEMRRVLEQRMDIGRKVIEQENISS